MGPWIFLKTHTLITHHLKMCTLNFQTDRIIFLHFTCFFSFFLTVGFLFKSKKYSFRIMRYFDLNIHIIENALFLNQNQYFLYWFTVFKSCANFHSVKGGGDKIFYRFNKVQWNFYWTWNTAKLFVFWFSLFQINWKLYKFSSCNSRGEGCSNAHYFFICFFLLF